MIADENFKSTGVDLTKRSRYCWIIWQLATCIAHIVVILTVKGLYIVFRGGGGGFARVEILEIKDCYIYILTKKYIVRELTSLKWIEVYTLSIMLVIDIFSLPNGKIYSKYFV